MRGKMIMKYVLSSEKTCINCVIGKLIDILCGDHKKSLKENLSNWIAIIDLYEDKSHGKTLIEWRSAVDNVESDEQVIDFLLLHFLKKSIEDYERLAQITEVVNPFDKYINEINNYSDIKKKLDAFIIELSNNTGIPLCDVIKHIKALIENYPL
jgi:hypothetical protein